MRAAVLTAYGETPAVGEFEEPRTEDGQTLVDVHAAGLNPIDLRVASGTLAARRPPLPSVVGSEGAGRTADGRRVYFSSAVSPWGSLAERTVAPDSELVEIPGDIEDAQAVAYGIAGVAAWLALERRAQVAPGETVIVLGATGAVGMIAVQAARLLGAARVVAVGRDPARLERAAELGASATVPLDREGEALTDELRAACGGDADVVFDPVWGAPASAALGALGGRGRLVQLGESAGAEATFASAAIRFKEISILGHTNFAAPPGERAAALQRMWGYAVAGQLHADVEKVALEDASAAWERQKAGPGAKLVLIP
jgi:NADPH2:quinone reductase